MKRFLSLAACLAVLLGALAGCAAPKEEQPRLKLLASFYPIAVMALNITDGVEGVEVQCMADKQTGCLHDFQLTTTDMKHMESADAFLINGAGMEGFLSEAAEHFPSLPVIDSSAGIPLMESGEEHAHDAGSEEGEEHEHNPHLWVSITNCMRQVENLTQGLMALDPGCAGQYRSNADAYLQKLAALRDKMHAALDQAEHRDIITFHEAFPYFAQEFGLHIAAVISREPGSEPSARELAETIRLVRSAGVKALFVEPQYSKTAADIVASETGARVYVLDPAVTGELTKDAYLNAMETNLDVLTEALNGPAE